MAKKPPKPPEPGAEIIDGPGRMTPERREAWRAAVAKTNHKPAGGAGKGPASGLPAMGDGWGGPARPGTPLEEFRAAPRRTKQEREALALDALATMEAIMRTSDQMGLRLMAAEKILNRVDGLPIARTMHADVDDVSKLSDDELREQLARLG